MCVCGRGATIAAELGDCCPLTVRVDSTVTLEDLGS